MVEMSVRQQNAVQRHQVRARREVSKDTVAHVDKYRRMLCSYEDLCCHTRFGVENRHVDMLSIPMTPSNVHVLPCPSKRE